jgi:Na+-driven multidrug efflux pump
MRHVFDLRFSMLRLRKDTALHIVKLGIPSGITQGIMSLAMLVVQSLTNSMGEMVMACNVIIMRVDGFAMMPNMTFGQAMSVYTGQNVGAGRLDRVDKGLKQGFAMAVGTATVITIVLRIPTAYTIAWFTRNAAFPNGRPEAIYVSLLISWSMGALISAIVFRRGNWRKKALGVAVQKQA